MPDLKRAVLVGTAAVLVLAATPLAAQEQPKPNILVIWGDDIGMYNIGAYNRGMLGGSTSNIDRIAEEGALFTDYYAQQSCTAGRAAFITGQNPIRTGLLTIGMPGDAQGLQDSDPTIAELLKPLGYATGQFGKNHLGDRNEFLPTVHGFDEFFGNLYHLNAEEEPETYFYPKDPAFHERFGPRGVLHCTATEAVSSQLDDPRFGAWGKQTCEDTGPLTIERMKNVDGEFLDAALQFIDRADSADEPFFVWFNSTRTHVWTHLSDEADGATGYGLYADAMWDHDRQVGALLDKLDELGIADNTIVIYSTDNGTEVFTFPDGGSIPFRGEKGTTWEGGFRVPAVVRWPGTVQPGTIVNQIFSHEDWMPTLLAAAGDPNVKDELLAGHQFGDKTFRVHLDGYDQTAVLSGEVEGLNDGPRHEILYFDAGGNLNALRYNDWKINFTIMEGSINEAYRKTPSWPVVVNLRIDPWERSPFEGSGYIRWYADQMWMFVPAQQFVANWLGTFQEYPPSQVVGSLSVDAILDKLRASQAAPQRQ